MPRIDDETPDVLKPYIFHGVDLTWKTGSREAQGDCPFCGSEKFTITVGDGLWRCLRCNEGAENGKPIKGGNNYTFIRLLHVLSAKRPLGKEGEALAANRGLLSVTPLQEWGVVRSVVTGDWLIPGYAADGKLNQLYKWAYTGGKFRLLATPGMGHCMFGRQLWDPKKPEAHVCEGPWDAMAWWEALRSLKDGGERGLIATSNPEAALGSDVNVVGVPGCETFFQSWYPMFTGKSVTFLYDSDHPRTAPNGSLIEPGGYIGTKRAAGGLLGAPKPPREVRYLSWGPEGYDPALAAGYDVRDALTSSGSGIAPRGRAVRELLGRVAQAPEAWNLAPRNTAPEKKGGTSGGKASQPGKGGSVDDLVLIPCTDYRTLIQAWRKAMKWTDGLDFGLSCMLATVASTKSVGDQLWMKVIGPPSCGKSTLCEALSSNKDYVLAKSTMRGFHSGTSDETGDDYSLIAKVNGKTLVTKDGDTLLQSPNLEQILSEARDVYDTVSRSSYRTKQGGRDYAGIRMTWLLCGTSQLRQIDASELGARFLDCVIMDRIDDEDEDEILMRVGYRAERNLSLLSDGTPDSHQEPEMTLAMQLTGGYVGFLRDNAQELLAGVTMADDVLRYHTRLGKFIAIMRARPSNKQDESAEREFAARLVSQLVRLSKCLAIVLNRTTVDEEVLRRTRKVAMDTARGISLDTVRALYTKPDGLFTSTIAMNANVPDYKLKRLLPFMSQIGATELFEPEQKPGGNRPQSRWRLAAKFRKLYDEVNR